MEQILFNLLSTGTAGFAGFLFFRLLGHGERIQRLEDITGNEVKELKDDVKELKREMNDRFKELETKMGEIAHNINKEKNSENQLNQTMKLILDYMMRHEKDIR